MTRRIKKSSLYLPEDLHRELKVLCAKLDLTLNQALERAVREWMSMRERISKSSDNEQIEK
jgi:hypothetical protein